MACTSDGDTLEDKNDYDICDVLHWRQTDKEKYLQTNTVLQAIIDGVCDDQSVLSLLNGLPDIIQTIWDEVVAWWKSCTQPGQMRHWGRSDDGKTAYIETDLCLDFRHSCVQFPAPTGIQVNMMPFVMARTFEESRLPDYLEPYWDAFFRNKFWLHHSYGVVTHLIAANQVGKIGYLTVDECFVKEGSTQRRPGLHTDCPGKLMLCRESDGEDFICLGRVTEENKDVVKEIIDSKLGHGYTETNTVDFAHRWGHTWAGQGPELYGGIYMASNVADSCAVWNCLLQPGVDGKEVIGNLGDVEHMRKVLPGKRETMKANKVYWITDRTPHESLPLKEGTYRQYFRLVTSEVSLWFEEHSTKNPCGVVPDPGVTKIVKGSKFENNFALLDLKMPMEEKNDCVHGRCSVA